jgi:AraC-like DNA-binding protein
MSFSALFSFAVLITGCIVISIVLNKRKDLPSRLLAFSLFSLNFTVLLIFLFESKYLLYVPFLFRTGSFFYYLVMPSFYLYAVFVLKSRKYLRWTDALHFLPALIYFVDFVPLFFSSSQDKLAIIRSLLGYEQRTVLHYNEGWFMPPGVHYLAPIVLGFVYVFLVGRLLLKYHRSGTQKKVLFRWLVTITSLYFLLMSSSLLVFVFAPAHQWLLSSICVMTFFFIISLVLFSNPDLLYGHYLNDEALKEKAGKKIKQVVLSIEKVTELKGLFEKYAAKEFYLNSEVDRKEVASYLNVQPHIFSAFISQAYQANFNDVINRYRIVYVEEGLKNGKWNDLTLEAIAEKAGFNNRVTFLTAFKKFTGTTPTQYIKNIQLQKTASKFNEKSAGKFV